MKMELLNFVCVHFNTEKPELKCPGQQSWNDGLVGEIFYPSVDPQNAYNQGVVAHFHNPSTRAGKFRGGEG